MAKEENKTPSLTETIQKLIDAKLFEIHTGLPAEIVSYNYTTNLAVVKPLLKRKYKSDKFPVSLPLISNVPVAFPRMGAASVRFPVNKKDTGKISFIERSIDKWNLQGGEVDPLDARKFSLSDAVFEPGLNPQVNPMLPLGDPKSLLIQNKLSIIEIKDDGTFKMEQTITGFELFDLLTTLLDELKTATDAAGMPFNAATIAKFEALRVKFTAMKG